MSSLLRRMQRSRPNLGQRVGVHNNEAKDLLARLEREKKHGRGGKKGKGN